MATATKKKTQDERRVFSDDALTPYSIKFTIRGVRDFFFNAGDVDAYEKADARREAGIKRRPEPNYEEKVWRHDGLSPYRATSS